jgi:hypothetical protein
MTRPLVVDKNENLAWPGSDQKFCKNTLEGRKVLDVFLGDLEGERITFRLRSVYIHLIAPM